MAFKEKEKIVERECEDFQPYMFNKRFCRMTFKCANAGVKYQTARNYMPLACYDFRCTGKELDEDIEEVI